MFCAFSKILSQESCLPVTSRDRRSSHGTRSGPSEWALELLHHQTCLTLGSELHCIHLYTSSTQLRLCGIQGFLKVVRRRKKGQGHRYVMPGLQKNTENWSGLTLVVPQRPSSRFGCNLKLADPQFWDIPPKLYCQLHLGDGKIVAASSNGQREREVHSIACSVFSLAFPK